jgi:hypothetical protein
LLINTHKSAQNLGMKENTRNAYVPKNTYDLVSQ